MGDHFFMKEAGRVSGVFRKFIQPGTEVLLRPDGGFFGIIASGLVNPIHILVVPSRRAGAFLQSHGQIGRHGHPFGQIGLRDRRIGFFYRLGAEYGACRQKQQQRQQLPFFL